MPAVHCPCIGACGTLSKEGSTDIHRRRSRRPRAPDIARGRRQRKSGRHEETKALSLWEYTTHVILSSEFCATKSKSKSHVHSHLASIYSSLPRQRECIEGSPWPHPVLCSWQIFQGNHNPSVGNQGTQNSHYHCEYQSPEQLKRHNENKRYIKLADKHTRCRKLSYRWISQSMRHQAVLLSSHLNCSIFPSWKKIQILPRMVSPHFPPPVIAYIYNNFVARGNAKQSRRSKGPRSVNDHRKREFSLRCRRVANIYVFVQRFHVVY